MLSRHTATSRTHLRRQTLDFFATRALQAFCAPRQLQHLSHVSRAPLSHHLAPLSHRSNHTYAASQLTHVKTIRASLNSNMSSQDAKVLSSKPMNDDEAKWVGLRAISWVDPTGKERRWEAADRKTRKGDVDAVAILAIIDRPSSEPHILLISQFRAPVEKSVIEMPAGLIDAGEEGDAGTRAAALRELQEETGYGTNKEGGKVEVLETSTTMVNDPGLSSANMKLCVVRIALADDAPEPVAQPEEGEFIEKHLVPLKGLYATLKDFQTKGFAVDARLAHLAVGLELGLGGFSAPKVSKHWSVD